MVWYVETPDDFKLWCARVWPELTETELANSASWWAHGPALDGGPLPVRLALPRVQADYHDNLTYGPNFVGLVDHALVAFPGVLINVTEQVLFTLDTHFLRRVTLTPAWPPALDDRPRETLRQWAAQMEAAGPPGRLEIHVAGAARGAESYVSSKEHVEILLDFARRGDQGGFVELAAMLGVEPDKLGPMWAGTLARLGRTA